MPLRVSYRIAGAVQALSEAIGTSGGPKSSTESGTESGTETLMRLSTSDLANFVGTHLLPFTNPRVVCPPGRVVAQGRRNIVVATPMRSGTHILIDLILNNLPAYRTRPLYVDLDQCRKQSAPGNDLIAAIPADAGYLLKTHMPLNVPEGMIAEPQVAALVDKGLVLTLRRPRAEVCRSLGRWHGLDAAEAEARYGAQYDAFWQVWEGRGDIVLDFADLFDPARMQALLARIGAETGTRPAALYRPPPSGQGRNRIYANKMLTRLLGRRARRIDTTIHTLK